MPTAGSAKTADVSIDRMAGGGVIIEVMFGAETARQGDEDANKKQNKTHLTP